MAPSPYVLGPCCCTLFWLILAVVFFKIGQDILETVDSKEYTKTTCSVQSTSYTTSTHNDKQYITCNHKLSTPLTGQQLFDEQSVGSIALSGNRTCAQFGSSCNYDLAGSCSGDCYAVFEDGKPSTISFIGADVVGIFGSIFLMGVGACFTMLCVCCCYCMPCVSSAMSEPQKRQTAVNPNMQAIGRGQQDGGGAAVHSNSKTQNFMDGISRMILLMVYLIAFFGTIGVVIGLFIRQILLYLADKNLKVGDHEVDSGAANAGVVFVAVSVVGTLILFVMLYVFRSQVSKALEEIGVQSSSEAEAQKIFVDKLISRLNSPQGEKTKKWLQECGVNPEDLEAVLLSPPEQMHLKLIDLLGAQVKARIMCKIIEEMLTPSYDQNVLLLIMSFLAVPGYLNVLTFFLAGFCAEFKAQPGLLGTGSSFVLLSFVFLMLLQWTYAFAGCLAAGLACSMVGVCATWGLTAFNAISLILWLMGANMFIVWLVLCAIWFCYAAPLIQAAFSYFLEQLFAIVWSWFGLTKNDGMLEEREANLWHKAGFFSSVLRRMTGAGSRSFLH